MSDSEASMNGSQAADAEASDDGNPLAGVVPVLRKTPFFQAVHAARYQRQALIQQIEAATGRTLVCYVSGSGCAIDRDDTVPMVDLLHNIEMGTDIDLLLHTGGGDIDAAEKLISMVRQRVGSGSLRAVVPDYAKSAGTLMVLGADVVMMSDTSELGPIDPQIVLADANGNRMRHAVQAHLDAYEKYRKAIADNPHDVASQIMLNKFEPAVIELFQGVLRRARQVGEELLKRGMFRDAPGGNWSGATQKLLDTKRWQSHGQMISWEDAADPQIGLHVEHVDPDTVEWQQIWQLYCLQRLAITDGEKLFESAYASLVVKGSVV